MLPGCCAAPAPDRDDFGQDRNRDFCRRGTAEIKAYGSAHAAEYLLADPIFTQMSKDGLAFMAAADHPDIGCRRLDRLSERGLIGNMICCDQHDEAICSQTNGRQLRNVRPPWFYLVLHPPQLRQTRPFLPLF